MWSPSTKTSAHGRGGGSAVRESPTTRWTRSVEAVAVERRLQLRVQLRPAQVGPQRDVEVVRPELGALRQRAREHQRRAALEAADLGDRGSGRHAPGEPVEQRRLVELERRDPVAELVRGEEEREILEAVERVGPVLDRRVPLQARIGLDGGVDEVLADPRPPCGAERPLHEVAQHGRQSSRASAGSPRPAGGRAPARRRSIAQKPTPRPRPRARRGERRRPRRRRAARARR